MFGPTGSTSSSSSPIGLQVNALSSDTLQYLGGKVGTIIEAKVVKVIGDAISKNNSAQPSTPPAIKSNSENVQQSRYIIDLSVNGQRLQVTAELAPRIGQVLQLEVLSAQTTRLVSTSAIQSPSSLLNIEQTLTTATKPAERINLAIPTDKLAATSQSKADTPITFIQQALRNSLPKQLGRSDILQSLLFLSNPKTALAPSTANPSSTQQAAPTSNSNINSFITSPSPSNLLKSTQSTNFITTANVVVNDSPKLKTLNLLFNQLSQSIPQQSSLETAAGVKQAIQNNGVFYEQKIGKIIESTQFRTSKNAIANTETVSKLNNEHTIENIRQKIQGEVIQKDIKFRLLKLAAEVKSLLGNNSNTTPESRLNSPALDRQAPLNALWQLDNASALQHLIQSNSTSSQRDLTDSLLQILRLSLGAAARTQSQQLFTLGSQFVSAVEANHTQTLAMELPIWLDQKLALIDLRLEREPNGKKKKGDTNTQWNIRLRFDLDEYGELTALASLRNRSMTAIFWASKDSLAKKINAELETMNNVLTNTGLTVQNLQCRTGTISIDNNSSIASLLESSLLNTKI